jgi:hypothetical protein
MNAVVHVITAAVQASILETFLDAVVLQLTSSPPQAAGSVEKLRCLCSMAFDSQSSNVYSSKVSYLFPPWMNEELAHVLKTVVATHIPSPLLWHDMSAGSYENPLLLDTDGPPSCFMCRSVGDVTSPKALEPLAAFVFLDPLCVEVFSFRIHLRTFENIWNMALAVMSWKCCRTHLAHSFVHHKLGLHQHSAAQNVVAARAPRDFQFPATTFEILGSNSVPPSLFSRLFSSKVPASPLSPKATLSQRSRLKPEGFMLDGLQPLMLKDLLFKEYIRFVESPRPLIDDPCRLQVAQAFSLLVRLKSAVDLRSVLRTISHPHPDDFETMMQLSVPSHCFRAPLFTQGFDAGSADALPGMRVFEENLVSVLEKGIPEDEYLRILRRIALHKAVLEEFLKQYSVYLEKKVGYTAVGWHGSQTAQNSSSRAVVCLKDVLSTGDLIVFLEPRMLYFIQAIEDDWWSVLEVGFKGNSVFINAFSFCSQHLVHVSSSLRPGSPSSKLYRVLRSLHLRSFAFDFQVQLFEQVILLPPPMFPLYNAVSCLEAMHSSFGGFVPRYARNSITSLKMRLEVRSRLSPRDFFAYLLGNADRYGLHSFGDALYLTQESCAVVASFDSSIADGQNDELPLRLLILVVSPIMEYTPQVDIAPERAEASLRATVRSIETSMQKQFSDAIVRAQEHLALDGLWDLLGNLSISLEGLRHLCAKSERLLLEHIDAELVELFSTCAEDVVRYELRSQFATQAQLFELSSLIIIRHPKCDDAFFLVNYSGRDRASAVESPPSGLYKRPRYSSSGFVFTRPDKWFIEHVVDKLCHIIFRKTFGKLQRTELS